MEKIIKALLGAKFPNIDADNLTAVVLNTPNPIYSTQILCGIYEEPSFEGHLKKKKYDIEYSFVKYTPDVHENEGIEYTYINSNGRESTGNTSLETWMSWESI